MAGQTRSKPEGRAALPEGPAWAAEKVRNLIKQALLSAAGELVQLAADLDSV